ncbi:MAG: hypothetical protein ACTSXT_01340 [Candidatus Helarchaeota archaeon]
MTVSTDRFNIEFTEKENFNVEIIQKELINVELKKIDLFLKALNGLTDVNVSDILNKQVLAYDSDLGKWVNKTIAEILKETTFINNEVPTKLTAKRFQTANNYQSGSLHVFLNGIKEKNITEVSSNTFDLPIDSISTDTIEVSYIEQ